MKSLKAIVSTPKKVFVSGLVGLIMTLVVIMLLTSCEDNLPEVVVTPPVISTLDVTSVTTTSAISGGNISSDGDVIIVARGLCYGLTSNPTISDNKTNDGVGTGNFSRTLSELIPGASYHLRAYVVTKSGDIFYGNDVSFITIPIMHSVIVTAGPNGSVDPLTKEVVNGASLEVKAIPDTGYMTDSITVDGKSFNLNGTNSYTVVNVSKKTEVSVVFKSDPKWVLSQHPWYTVMEKGRYVNTIPWYTAYPSNKILIEKYEFYQSGNDFKIKVNWPDKGTDVYEYVCTLKGDSLIWGTRTDGTKGMRMKIIHLDPQSLVLQGVNKYYDINDNHRVPEKDTDVQYFFEQNRSYK